MTKRRTDDFSLEEALRDVGFTPQKRDVPGLLSRIERGDEAERSVAEKALLRVQSPIAAALAERAQAAEGDALVRLVRLTGQVASRAEDAKPIQAMLCAVLVTADARGRRAAATALGKIHDSASEDALLEALEREAPVAESAASRDPNVLEAIVLALGKIGGARALARLDEISPGLTAKDAVHRAKLMLGRTVLRQTPSGLVLTRSLREPLSVSLRCREGLEEILVGELDPRLSPRIAENDPGRVDVTLRGAPASLFTARTFLSFGFASESIAAPDEDISAVVARMLAHGLARRILTTFTEGPIRFRVAWAGGGKHRKASWDIASEILRRAPELVNDPTESSWEVVVRELGDRRVRLELVPRADDPRFAYRRADVPAASHPTLAAALVRVAGIREDDVVWDPFVGSGGELCERMLAGPAAMLIGSDIDDRALAAARKNLDEAGAAWALLRRADARTFDPRAIGGRARGGMTAIITNPPMGRRVARGDDLEALLVNLVSRAPHILAPGGRLVWLSPLPRATRAAAERARLELRSAKSVDMGGFTAELQVLERSSN